MIVLVTSCLLLAFGLWNVSVLLDSEEFLETKTVENSGWVCVDLIMPGVGMISLESQR